MMFAVFPRDNPAQAVRLRRFMMAGVTYLVAVLMVGMALMQGLMELRAVTVILACTAVVNLAFFAAFRSGFNLRFSDPSLTMAQMIGATLVLMLVAYHAGPARGTFLLLYFAAFVFGVFRLSTAQFLAIGAFALSNYAMVIAVLAYTRPDAIDLSLELLQWFALGCVLAWFSFLGGYISRLRQVLRHSNEELRQAMKTIAEMAIRDELTGLYNRRHAMSILTEEKQRLDRLGGTLSVALLDLDLFKKINDRFGHMVGDEALRRFAEVAGQVLRKMDRFGRFGGEEFIVIMPGTDLAEATLCAERLRREIETYDCGDLQPDLKLSVSVGLAEYRPGEGVTQLLERCDAALYRAKSLGRNRVEHSAA